MPRESDSSCLHVHLTLARILLDLGFRQSGVAPGQNLPAIAVVREAKLVGPIVVRSLLSVHRTGVAPLRRHLGRARGQAATDGVVGSLDVLFGIDPWPAGRYPLHFLEWFGIFAVRVQQVNAEH